MRRPSCPGSSGSSPSLSPGTARTSRAGTERRRSAHGPAGRYGRTAARSANACGTRRRGAGPLRRPATRRKCTAEPRSAKEWRWISAAKLIMAKEEQGMHRQGDGTARHSIGAIGEGWARKRTAPRRTGNGPIRSGVEQPSWDRLRMATAQTRCATSGDGKAKYRSAMAKQSRGMQRRWTDTGSEGVALMSRAWRKQSEAWQGEGKAKHSEARRRHSRAKP